MLSKVDADAKYIVGESDGGDGGAGGAGSLVRPGMAVALTFP